MPRLVYLDVCALCRPFDDQQQVRIRLETDAVQLILTHVRQKNLKMITSPMHFDDKLLRNSNRFGVAIWTGFPMAFCEKEGLE